MNLLNEWFKDKYIFHQLKIKDAHTRIDRWNRNLKYPIPELKYLILELQLIFNSQPNTLLFKIGVG